MFRTMQRLLILTFASLTLPMAVGAQEGDWNLRGSAVWVEPSISFLDLDGDDGRIAVGADSELGLGLNLERRFSQRLGLELGALSAEPDLTVIADLGDGFQLSASEGVSFTAVTAGLNIHLTPDRAVDLYVGPLVAYVLFGDVSLRAQVLGVDIAQDFSSDDDFALGAQIGADFKFGESPWSLNLTAKYLDTRLEITDDEGEVTELGFEPLILSAGFGYRF